MITLEFFFVGPSMPPSIIIAQHKDLKKHPHANNNVTIVIIRIEL